MTTQVREVRGQGACEKFLKTAVPGDHYKCFFAAKAGFLIVKAVESKIVDKHWHVGYFGAVPEEWLQEMLKFISNEADTSSSSERAATEAE